MLETDQKKVWKARAATYNNLKWANNEKLKQQLLKYASFERSHVVLDAGIGTGAVALAVAPHVKEVHGIDISPEMMSFIPKETGIITTVGTITKMDYDNGKFDRIMARNVFHNILGKKDRAAAATECLRVLKSGGKFILQEGVPPHSSIKKDFEKIFALKEKRMTFTPEELGEILREAGFYRIETHVVPDPDFDLNNWLDNDGTLSQEAKKRIISLHVNSSGEFKKHYNLRRQNGTVLIDTKAAIVIGEKP